MENDQCNSYYDPADYLSPTEYNLRNKILERRRQQSLEPQQKYPRSEESRRFVVRWS